MPSAADRPRPFRNLILIVLGAFLVFWVGWKLLQAMGILNQVQRSAVSFKVLAGPVNVSMEGADMRRVEEAKLFASDRIVSNTGGKASLRFFDGSIVGIDELSEVTIDESSNGTKSASIALTLITGRLVVAIPQQQSDSAAVPTERTIVTPGYTVTLPAGTRAVVEARAIRVLEAEDLGVTVTVDDVDDAAFIGEGQQLVLPAGTPTGSLYAYRDTIDPMALRVAAAFSLSALPSTTTGSGSSVNTGTSVQDVLTVSSPTQNQQVTGATVRIEGKAGPGAARVRINGHDANVDIESGAFSQDLSVSKGTTMDILVEALDERNVVVMQVQRTVRLKPAEFLAPTIVSPAAQGSVYRTNKKKFEISGTAPAGAASITVNDYKLLLFKEGDSKWTYLANADLGNVLPGRNVFTVIATDSDGKKSPPATLTILLEEGAEGIVTAGTTGSAASAAAEPEQADEATLPKNAPLSPGTLTITAPTTGEPYTATGSEVLIEGTTAASTDSVWVNGYKLRLYKPGATFWNYFARTQYATLKKGLNTYVINARNAKGEIVDTATYQITY